MAESADGEVTVPPTLRALLTARLDQVEAAERRCSSAAPSRASSSTAAPCRRSPPRSAGHARAWLGLVRRELIRPDRALYPGDDGFRFRHLLIRDAAYEALPKATRAELHLRFAAGSRSTAESLSSWTRSPASISSGRTSTAARLHPPIRSRARSVAGPQAISPAQAIGPMFGVMRRGPRNSSHGQPH